MSIRPLSEVQAHLADVCREVAATGQPVVIECEGQENVVLMPTKEIEADSELTQRILGGPENEKRLRAAVAVEPGEELISATFEDLCKSIGVDARDL